MTVRAEQEEREGIVKYENLIISYDMSPKNYEILSEKHYYDIGFRRWHINTTITILDIIHRPVFYLKTRRIGDCILPPPTQMDQKKQLVYKRRGFLFTGNANTER
jgi:hypothetical protein